VDSLLVPLLILVLILGLALLAFIAFRGRGKSRLDRAAFAKRWQHIETLKNQNDTAMTLAIIEADKLLDQALKANGYPGETMGERLKDARNVMTDNNGVWQAHKLRNQIVHEHDVRLNRSAAGHALGSFKTALKNLGAL
jgi:hypothetical protein